MSIDWNKIKSNAKAKDDKQYEEMKADTSKRMAATAAAEKAAQPSVTERVGKTVTGAGKGSAAEFTNLGGVVVEGLNKVGTYLQSKKDAQKAAQDREYLSKYDQDLKDAIAAGDAKVDNSKFKGFFHKKATMLPHDKVEEMTGHPIGGVCPFGVKEGVRVYLDISLKRFDIVYPAAGTASSAVKLTVDELYKASGALDYIDVCKCWQTEE